MQSINLKKILLKREILSLLRGLVNQLSYPIVIQDQKGKVLVANLGMDAATIIDANSTESSENPAIKEGLNKVPVVLSDEILGWVIGNEKVEQVADFLSYIVNREFEQKTLAADALDKYREINLLYTISSKLSTCLDVKEIGTLVIEEASRLIPFTSSCYAEA
jgi:adenylate cyclase